MEYPRVSVIICHHTGQDLLARCLASVATSKGVEVETIVVPSDPTYLNEEARVYFLQDGPAAKRNLGVRQASASMIAFLDDDCEIGPYTLYELSQWIVDHSQTGMAYGKIRKMDRRDIFDAAG